MTTAEFTPPPHFPPPAFLRFLAGNGFRVGPEQALRLTRLFAVLPADTTAERLVSLMSPLFATNEDEQVRFRQLFEVWLQHEAASLPAAPHSEPHRPEPGRTVWRRLGWAAVLLVFGMAAGSLYYFTRSPQSTAPPPPQAAVKNPTPEGRNNQPAPPTPPVPRPTPKPSASGLARADVRIPNQPADQWRQNVSIFAFAIACAFTWLALQRWFPRRKREPPPAPQVPAPPRAARMFPLKIGEYPGVRALISHLGRAQQSGPLTLDVGQTIRATIQALGFPQLRYARQRGRPTYFVLIERASGRDHLAEVYLSVVRELKRNGIRLSVWLSEGESSICFHPDSGESAPLTTLRTREAGSRLILFSDGEKLFDRLSGDWAPWASDLLRWDDRFLVTARAESSWNATQRAAATHFRVLPFSWEDVSWTWAFSSTLRGRRRATVGARPAPEEPEWERGRELAPYIRGLEEHLGSRLFAWLCACSLCSQLETELTLRIGAELYSDQMDDPSILKLFQLRWYREGAMPVELQQALTQRVPERDVARIRSIILDHLIRETPPPGDYESNVRQLEMAVQRWSLSALDRASLQTNPDHLDRLAHRSPSRLLLKIPSTLRRYLFLRGVPVLGARKEFIAALAAAALLLVLAAAFTPRGESAPEIRWTPPGVPDFALSVSGAPVPSPEVIGADLKLLRTLTVPAVGDLFQALAFSPDGAVLATVTQRAKVFEGMGQLQLWDSASGKVVRVLAAPAPSAEDEFCSVAFQPAGTLIAVSTCGIKTGKVMAWNAQSAQLAFTIPTKEGLRQIAFSPDGQLLAGASDDFLVRIWNAHSGALISSFRHRWMAVSLSFSPDGAELAEGDFAQSVIVRNLKTGTGVTLQSAPPSYGDTVAFSPDGNTLATGHASGALILWDWRKAKPLRYLQPSGSYLKNPGVQAVAWSPDGRILAGRIGDALILWAPKRGTRLAQLSGIDYSYHMGNPSLAFDPTGRTLAAVDAASIRIYSVYPALK